MKNLIFIYLAVLFTSHSLVAAETLWPQDKVQKSRDCIFQIVAKKMNVQINPAKKRAALKLQGTTSLKEFQNAMEKFWGWRPDAFMNAFNPVTNEIYLHTIARHYLSNGRSIYDSLAHEYAHYIQLNYLGRDLEDEYNENEAVDVQTWFRETYSTSIKQFDFSCPTTSTHLTIDGATEIETAQTKIAYKKLVDYFLKLGITISPKIKVVFEDEVFTVDAEGQRTQVYGYFDTDKEEIHLMHFKSEGQSGRFVWRIDWSDEMASSFLLHELAHLMTVSALGHDFKKLNRAWHEWIAYSIQFELMPVKLRGEILKKFPAAESSFFENFQSVNVMNYGFDPETFAVRSWRSYRHWGGIKFLKLLLNGKVHLPTYSE